MMSGVVFVSLACRWAAKEGTVVKSVMSLLIAVWLVSGCMGSAVTHEDSPGAVKRDQGPTLCRDGSTPPCNDRD
jgi:hypothetical protein